MVNDPIRGKEYNATLLGFSLTGGLAVNIGLKEVLALPFVGLDELGTGLY